MVLKYFIINSRYKNAFKPCKLQLKHKRKSINSLETKEIPIVDRYNYLLTVL